MVTAGILPFRENSHGRTGNRTRDLMISSQRLWPLNHEAGHYWDECSCGDLYTALNCGRKEEGTAKKQTCPYPEYEGIWREENIVSAILRLDTSWILGISRSGYCPSWERTLAYVEYNAMSPKMLWAFCGGETSRPIEIPAPETPALSW